MGVANDRSLAWGIAKSLHEAGAELAFTYQGEALGKRVRPLAESLDSDFLRRGRRHLRSEPRRGVRRGRRALGPARFPGARDRLFRQGRAEGQIPRTRSRDNFLRTLDISCFSFTDLCRRAAPLMTEGGSLLTLTYSGAERVMPHYNVMGVAKAALEASVRYLAVDLGGDNIRVNAISAGPIKTLAASAIGDFRYILKWNQLNSPLQRNVTIEDVGGAGRLSAERSVGRGHRRGAPRRLRLSCRRHEARRRPRHLDRVRMAGVLACGRGASIARRARAC